MISSSLPPSSPFRCVLDARARLGECPVWSVAEQVLYWVDINAPALSRFDPSTGANTAMPMPQSIGCFALRRDGGFIVALRDGIWLAAPDGALMRLDADHRLTAVLGDMMISNGLAWSPDGATMYHADTPTLTVRAYDYDARTGTPANGRVHVEFTGATDRPDGAAVDSEGCYWSAFYRGGKVVRIAPSGTLLAEYPVPAMCPTMCAFGGPDLATLYVTTARQHRDSDELARLPQSGGLFAMRVEVPGLPEPAYAG